jgi:hypothetical protein
LVMDPVILASQFLGSIRQHSMWLCFRNIDVLYTMTDSRDLDEVNSVANQSYRSSCSVVICPICPFVIAAWKTNTHRPVFLTSEGHDIPVFSMIHPYPRQRMQASFSQGAMQRYLLRPWSELFALQDPFRHTPTRRKNMLRSRNTISIARSSDPEARYTPS